MCGIAGSINWHGTDDPEIVRRMTDRLYHRGPDTGNIKQLDPCILGHRRLKVIDTSTAGDQPMGDVSGRYWISYNGEIYNFRELRRELEALGSKLRTHSDTEVLVEAWARWGIQTPQKLIGMFAFAVWDIREQTLHLVRDRMGEKPLFYALFSNGIAFASEIPALMEHPAVIRDINPEALSHYLSLGYITGEHSIYTGIKKLLPAHRLTLGRDKTPDITRYWRLANYFQHKNAYTRIEEAEEQLNALLRQSTAGTMLADVPLGAFLSGGMDSSTVVAMMTKQKPSSAILTFSAGFREKTYSEIAESKEAAEYFRTTHRTFELPATAADDLPAMMKAAGEPFADTSIIPMYHLARQTRNHVTVALSGDGGDELFAGYDTYLADWLHHRLRPLLGSLSGVVSAALSLVPASRRKVGFDYKLKHFLAGGRYPFERAHYSWRQIFSDAMKLPLLAEDVRDEVMHHDPFSVFQSHFDEVRDCHYLDQAMYVDMQTWLADDILVKVDRMTMAHSLESRCPLLDHRIVEFAASLPVEWKMHGRQRKYILKKAMRHELPETIVRRKKAGFNAPVSHWLAGPLHAMGQEVTMSRSMQEFIRKDTVEILWREHCSRKHDHGFRLFALVMLGLWMEHRS